MIDIILFHLNQPWIRFIKTIYLNFKLLPWNIAVKLPIYLYGPVNLYWLKGKIEIKSNKIYRGMIKLGRNYEYFNGSDGSSFIYMSPKSTIIFNGPCAIGNNYKIRVETNAILEFGEYNFFGSSIKFICTDKIKIGHYTRCAYESQIIDTNSHFVYNEKNNKVARKKGSIEIGDFNWIGNRTTITKGTKTKEGTIVCANSTLNKDFTKLEENHQMLGGIPAKLITSGLKRIFSTKIDKQIEQYFSSNKDEEFYTIKTPFIDNYNDIIYWFKKIM